MPGGGPSLDGARWVACRPGFFLPVRVLARLFRRLFLRDLQNAYDAGTLRFSGPLASLADADAFNARLAELRRIDWVVYAKPPFGGPRQALAYLGRYTHRVAIANSRLLALEDGKVSFTWKDYRKDGVTKVMTLDATEFIRRFLLHILPDGFHRIRHYGFLANGDRRDNLDRCRRLIAFDAAASPDQPTPLSILPQAIRLRPPPAARNAAASCAASPSCRVRLAPLSRSSATPHDHAAEFHHSCDHAQGRRGRSARSRPPRRFTLARQSCRSTVTAVPSLVSPCTARDRIGRAALIHSSRC